MPPKKKKTSIPGGARKRRGGFPCPDCSFVAKHAMGLGRHRSARHGVMSQRQRRSATAGPSGWITREQAAQRAGVHYNTIRQWEQSGALRQTKRPGTRGALVSVTDLTRLLAQRSGGPASTAGSGDGAAVAALEQRFAQLIEGLELLVASVKGSAGRKRSAASSRTTKRTTKRTGARATQRAATKSKAGRRGAAKKKRAKRTRR